MSYIIILAVLVTGLSGIVAEVLILRELLVSFYGNELTLGIILANWLIAEALGVYLVGRYIDRARNKINVFLILLTVFSITLPLSIYLSRIFKGILGIPFGEGLGVLTMLYVSLLIILPVAISHGALFSCACRIYRSIGKVYYLETLGTIMGGFIITYLFIPYLNTFQIAFIIAIANIFICLLLFKYISTRVLKYTTIPILFLVIYLFLSGNVNNIQRLSINRQYKTVKIIDYQNSIYGNIVVSQRERQNTFFYNGLPIITTPYPDITFVEEFGNLPLLFHGEAKNILVISGGAGGVIKEILKHPVERIDYAELDPLVIEMLKKHSSKITRQELEDKRVRVVNLDGRFFVRTTPHEYDLVLIGLSQPSDLSVNRLFTQEFFSLVKKRLNSGGILAFTLPGSLTYLSPELRDINACILNGLKNVYNYVRIIPGDYNMFLASDSGGILEVTPALITRRLKQQGIRTRLLIPSYLDYRLNKRWLVWFKESSVGATKKINQDLMPFALFKMLSFWNKRFSPVFARFFIKLEKIDLKLISALIFIITFIFFFIFYRRPRLAKLNIAYSIATTGFFGMLVSLILIFSFQVFYGYLYHIIGILISLFMVGIAAGSILITQGLQRIKQDRRLFIILEFLIVGFTFGLALIIPRLSAGYIGLFFILSFLTCGFLVGAEFPLASKIYLGTQDRIGSTAGLLYSADLLGGWFAGILGGIVFLPILGLFNTCMVVVLLKSSSLFLLSTKYRDTL